MNHFTQLLQPKQVTTHYGLLTDITHDFHGSAQELPAGVPGIRLAFTHEIKETMSANHALAGGLIHGSSPTPVAYIAFTVGRHSFYALLNPLDATLRPHMLKQFASQCLPLALHQPNGKVLRGVSRIAAHKVALEDTYARPAGDCDEWLRAAETTAPFVPLVTARFNPELYESKWHHVYFIIPDDSEHPLSKRIIAE